MRKIAGSGFETPASSDTTSASTNGSRPHTCSFSCCSSSRLLDTIPTRAWRLTAAMSAAAPATGLLRARYVSRYIAAISPATSGRPSSAHRPQQPPKPLDARGLERHATEHHVSVQILQKARVRPLERVEWHGAQRLVCLLDGGERLARAASVVEQCVVEIEQDRLNHRCQQL